MDFWAENQGHLPQYSKFNTLPSRSYAQHFHDRQPPPPQYQVYCEEQRGKTIDSVYYWPPRDATNWTNQESPGPTSPLHFPFNLDHRIPHYQGEQRQELQDWTTYPPQERGYQHDGCWSYNPVHYKRELSKKNDNNFRELEAWALRYSHSLPRRRRIEAELRGAMQDNVERREMQAANVQESTLRDRASRQQAVNYYQTAPQSQNLDGKDKISYQTKMYSHPPNYNAPPPYSVQYRNVLTQQTLAKQSYELPQVVKKTEKELYEKSTAKVEAKGLDILQGRQLLHRRSSSDAAKVIEGRKFQLNKKAGGMTIFCLVSRIADAEPENEPVSPKRSEVVQPKASDVSEPSKQADEVDFKIQTSTKQARSPYSKLQAIPICKESLSKMADKNAQKSNDVSAIGRLAAKFPLWRRPSFTSSVETDNASTTCSKDISESNLQDEENDSKSGGKTDTDSEKVGAKDGDATLMIDTTCVVVKMELLKAPKKEQVHYLSSEDQTKTGQTLANEEIPAKQQDTGQILAEQANSKDVVEGTKTEDSSPTNPETLEERAKRICGLKDSPMTQQKDDLDFAIEELTKQNDEFNGEFLHQKEMVNTSSVSKNENSEPLQVSSYEDEKMEMKTEIGEVGESKENSEDFEMEKFKMAESLEQESNVEARSEMNDSVDISDSLELNILQTPNENSNSQQRLEDVASKVPESEAEDDNKDFIQHEKGATLTIFTAEKIDNLSENIVDLQEQEAKKKISDGSSDLVTKIKNCDEGELNWPVETDIKKDSLSELETCEEPIVEATAINNLQQLDSGQIEEAPTLDKSEIEQNQCVKLTEKANVELYGCDLDKLKSVPKDEDIEVATNDSEIQETINEIKESVVDESTDKEQSDVLQASTENAENFDLKEQFGSKEKACSNEDEVLITNIDEPVIGADVQGNQGFEPTTLTDPQVQLLSEDVEHNAGKGESMMQLFDDQKDVNDANLSNFEMPKNMKQSDKIEFGEDECSNCVKLNNTEFGQKGSSDCVKLGSSDCIQLKNNREFGQEESLDCIKRIDKQEFGQEECSDCIKLNDNSVLGQEDCSVCVELNENTEFGQEEHSDCAELSDNTEFGQEKHVNCKMSVQNVEVDHLEVTPKEEVVRDKEKREEIVFFDAKISSETAAILVDDGEAVNESEIPKNIDSEHIFGEMGKITLSECVINDFDLQQCQWEDAIVDSNIMKDGLNVKDTEESYSEICQSAKSEDILQAQVHPPDKNVTDSSLVCHPESVVNTGAAILERPCISMDNSPHPSTSTCENVCCEEDGKCPKSLWDAVSRIRKHTAPDSENEEEEITDNWDRESLVSVENVFDTVIGDMESGPCYEDLNVQDDTFSQCSNTSQESDGTIVDDDLEETEITNIESVEVYNEDHSCDEEEQGQSAAQTEETMNQTQSEEFPTGLSAEMAENIML